MVMGIRDKVAILGMGCSRFGERWDADPAQLMAEAFEEAIEALASEPTPEMHRRQVPLIDEDD